MWRRATASKRRLHVYAPLSLTIFVMGCAPTPQVPTRGGFESGADSTRLRKGVEVVGYVTDDGVYHSFRGTARLEDQSWHFVRQPVWGQAGAEVTVPRDSVQSLDVEKGTYRNPTGGSAGIAIIAAGLMAVLISWAAWVGGYH